MSEFSVEWSRRARRDLAGLDATVQMRILMRVQKSRGDPLRFFEPLKGTRGYKLRVGDWRIIADVTLSERTIFVVAIGHRRNVYGH